MSVSSGRTLIVRKLTESDLGWFAEPRRAGATRSKQRAINFNSEIIGRVLPPHLQERGEVRILARCVCPGAFHTEERILSKVHKNWRLGGTAVQGKVFGDLAGGDYFLGVLDGADLSMMWTACLRARDPEGHAELERVFASELASGMTTVRDGSNLFEEICIQFLPDVRVYYLGEGESATPALPPAKRTTGIPPIPSRPAGVQRKLGVKDRLRQPHILAQMMTVSSALSANAQMDFLRVLETLAAEFQRLLRQADLLGSIEVNHRRLWDAMKGSPVAFVDGGEANLAALGAAPVAVRVGSYVVTPGLAGPNREEYGFEKQLVDELYEPSRGGEGFFEGLADDLGRLRDVARITLESAGAWAVTQRKPAPRFVMLHGALVVPVSIYESVPRFSRAGLECILSKTDHGRQGRDAHFISVYLHLLQLLRGSTSVVAGVVERASLSAIVAQRVLELLHEQRLVDGAFVDEACTRLREYRITDTLLFNCVLGPGEYVKAVDIDRNDMRRAAPAWADVVCEYPRPRVLYVKPSEMASVIRVEMFSSDRNIQHVMADLVVHSSRLLPKYVFPAGLDIVDKHAKIPDWMSRPVNQRLAAQLMRRALESGNPAIINEARRMLCGDGRDWLFRPTFERG